LEFAVTHFPSGCGAQPECDSIETRKAVLQFISEDRNNPLLDYAARNSTTKVTESTKPLYQLGQRMVTTSTSRDKLTLKCSGAPSAAVGNLKATKEVNFTVQQTKDGKLSVSVGPFQF
jgi:hypothetical protein